MKIFLGHLRKVVTPGNPQDKYEVHEEVLGQGYSGLVRKATVKATGEEAAIKQMDIVMQIRRNDLIGEINAMQQNSDANIVKYMDSYLVDEKEVWIVMEYFDGGSVKDILTKGELQESEIATICREVLNGLEFLHGKNWIHRDIKSSNILLGSDGRVKLADFYFGVHLTPTRPQRASLVGTTLFNAPEVIMGYPYGTKVDVWSLGITAYEMLTLIIPNSEITKLASYGAITMNESPNVDDREGVTDEFKVFLGRCLEKNVSKRADVAELLELKFIKAALPTSTLMQRIKDAQKAPLIEVEFTEDEGSKEPMNNIFL